MKTKKYPLSIEDQREIAPDYTGPVFVWDIDKTYLSTRFSSLGGLGRIPIEFAVDKQAIPGMPSVLRGLRRGPGAEFACSPLYFISASPPQLRKVVTKKMLLDGVEWDGIIFKDWLGTLMQLRPGRLKDQLGFKLSALLTGRQSRPLATEYLFGDDVEKDAEAFALYAEVMAGELGAGELEQRLVQAGVPTDDRKGIQNLISALPTNRGQVGRIYIHLETNHDPQDFAELGPRVVPVKGACQMALALYAEELLGASAVSSACRAVKQKKGYRYGNVDEMLADAKKRGLINDEKISELELPGD